MKSILLVFILFSAFNLFAQKKKEALKFSENFNIEDCSFSTVGKNKYFILEPGYKLFLEGADGKDTARLVITVLNETKKIGNIETRIVEEHESVNGNLIEISRNYFAVCKETNTVFYFGEEVDIYQNGKIVNHSGAWVAEGKNKAGVVMPGLPLLGSRYFQEIAPGIAMDRAEIISDSEVYDTPAGKFTNVLKTLETTPLEPKDKSYKFYAPGIGLINDGELKLIRYGFINN